MQPLKSIAPQWEAKDKKLRPCNPFPYNYDHDIYPSLEWDSFEETAKLHEFDTDLPDRIYNADELNEPVWEYKLYNGPGGLWLVIDSYWIKDGLPNHSLLNDVPTRQFVTLKQPTQTTI